MKHLRWALIMGLFAASCGDSDGGSAGQDEETPSDEIPSDAGGGGGEDSGSPGGGTDGLMINAALGLEVIDHPPEGETNLERSVLVTRDGERAASPTVSVNGVAFEEDRVLMNFFKAPQGFQFNDIGAGKTLRVVASDTHGETSLELPCPNDVQITAPKAGDVVRSGDKVTVSWSGDAHVHNVDVVTPSVQFHQPNEFNGKWAPIFDAATNVEKGEASIEVSIPQVTGEQIIALQLHVPGPFITTNAGQNSGICWLVRRIELNVAQ